MRRIACHCLCLFSCLCAKHVLAHDLWISLDNKTYSLYQGHAHSTHTGDAVVPYNPNIVKSAYCAKQGADTTSLALSKTHPVKFSGNCDAVMVSLSSGHWTKTAWETKNIPKAGVSGILKSWRSEESIKRINRWSSESRKSFNKGFEITPLNDPFALNLNDKLVVKVTHNGKPVAGVPVAYQGDTRGNSGTDGTVTLRVRKSGVQLFSASLETPLNDGKADSLIRSTSLQFDLSK